MGAPQRPSKRPPEPGRRTPEHCRDQSQSRHRAETARPPRPRRGRGGWPREPACPGVNPRPASWLAPGANIPRRAEAGIDRGQRLDRVRRPCLPCARERPPSTCVRLLAPARPAGRQGAGQRLSRRVGHLAVAVHAGSRSVRYVVHRGAARRAGNALRVGFALRHGTLHPPTSRRSASSRAQASSASARWAAAVFGNNAKFVINVPLGPASRPHASPLTTPPSAAASRPSWSRT